LYLEKAAFMLTNLVAKVLSMGVENACMIYPGFIDEQII
jgi:hypothetical protein